MLLLTNSSILFSFVLILSLSVSLKAQQYKSFNDFISKNKVYLSLKSSLKSAPPSILFSTTTTTTTTIITLTTTTTITTPTTTISTSTTTTISTSNIKSKLRSIFVEFIELVCGLIGSYICVITFKFVRNDFRFKINWIIPKFQNYHTEETEHENINGPDTNDLVVLESP